MRLLEFIRHASPRTILPPRLGTVTAEYCGFTYQRRRKRRTRLVFSPTAQTSEYRGFFVLATRRTLVPSPPAW